MKPTKPTLVLLKHLDVSYFWIAISCKPILCLTLYYILFDIKDLKTFLNCRHALIVIYFMNFFILKSGSQPFIISPHNALYNFQHLSSEKV